MLKPSLKIHLPELMMFLSSLGVGEDLFSGAISDAELFSYEYEEDMDKLGTLDEQKKFQVEYLLNNELFEFLLH